MSPGFKSRRWSHMWVEFVVGSLPCHECFYPGTPVFPSPQKLTFPNSKSTRNQVDKEPLCGCATFFIYLEDISSFLFSGWVSTWKSLSFFSNGQYQCAIRRVSQWEWYPYVSLFPDVLCNNCFQCHRMTQNTFQERYTLFCFTGNQYTTRRYGAYTSASWLWNWLIL